MMGATMLMLGVALQLPGWKFDATQRGVEVPLFAGEEASYSPDGRQILFQRFEGERMHVFVRDIASGRERSLREGAGDALQATWRTDGAILYTWVSARARR